MSAWRRSARSLVFPGSPKVSRDGLPCARTDGCVGGLGRLGRLAKDFGFTIPISVILTPVVVVERVPDDRRVHDRRRRHTRSWPRTEHLGPLGGSSVAIGRAYERRSDTTPWRSFASLRHGRSVASSPWRPNKRRCSTRLSIAESTIAAIPSVVVAKLLTPLSISPRIASRTPMSSRAIRATRSVSNVGRRRRSVTGGSGLRLASWLPWRDPLCPFGRMRAQLGLNIRGSNRARWRRAERIAVLVSMTP